MPTTRNQYSMQRQQSTTQAPPLLSNYTDCSCCGELTQRPAGADISTQITCSVCLPFSEPAPLSSLGQVYIPLNNPAGQISMFDRWQQIP